MAVRYSDEVEAVALRFLESRADGDVDAATNLHSTSEHIRLIGSDEHEWYQGAEVLAIWEAVRDHPSNAEHVRVLRSEGFEHGDTGWAHIEQLRRRYEDGWTYVIRISFVLVLEAGSWRVVHAHYSTPVPDEELVGVSLTKGLSGLLAEIEHERDDSLNDSLVGTATIVFTDIVGSTELSQSMTDHQWASTISDHFHTAQRIVEGEGGSVVKTLGDGGMFAFTSGSSALEAATDIQHTTRKASSRIELRIGVHTGDVVHDESDYIGLTVSKAARVAAAAGPGQILVSSATAEMVNPARFRFGEPILVKLQGISGTHSLRPLMWEQ